MNVLAGIFLFLAAMGTLALAELTATCSGDAACTDLCGRAGAGRCVNGTHCVCDSCPQRSTEEISADYKLKVCTLDPVCHTKCPSSSLSPINGRIYSGHLCSSITNPTDPTCICFCMPTTLESLQTVIRCPAIPINKSN